MTLIEHFLMDNIQKLFRDGIEKTIPDIGRYIAPTDIFLSTLWNFISKRWPIIFFYGIGSFVVRCRLQNLQCRSALSFRASGTEVVFRPTLACSHLIR